MSEETPDQTVSQEAFDRVNGQREALEAKVTDLEASVKGQAYMEKARQHFVAKQVKDPDWAAGVAVHSMEAVGTEVENIPTYLDDNFANLYPTDPPATPDPEGDTEGATPVATPDAVEPPGFARPSPAGGGDPPEQEVYTIESPEVQALIEANDKATLQQWGEEGKFRFVHTKE